MQVSHPLHLLAFDLGASTGRAMLGMFDGKGLNLQEIYRFHNQPVRIGDHLYTDVLYLWTEMQHGLQKAASQTNGRLDGIGVDTWGVDFALLDNQDRLLANPNHYRDAYTRGSLSEALKKVSLDQIYAQTGNQVIEFNTLFQLFSLKLNNNPALESAHSLLMLPDLFNFWLSGLKASEYTVASTSQCFNPIQGTWAFDLLNRLELPTHFFQSIVPAGTRLGKIHSWLADQSGCSQAPVIAPACHDTGSAVAAVPVSVPDFMYISSGTWSLVGVELPHPLINEQTLISNLANEGGVGNRTRLLKITPGMWLLQQCGEEWNRRGKAYSYEDLTTLAEKSPPFGPLLNVNDTVFYDPGDMPSRIQVYCQSTFQPIPQTTGEIVRTILESLALEYSLCLQNLETLLGYSLQVIHIIGGGSRNSLLNQLTANLTQRPVLAGPVEATVAGNVLVQAMALGYLDSLDQLRQVMCTSFAPHAFKPYPDSRWDDAVERYQRLGSSKEKKNNG